MILRGSGSVVPPSQDPKAQGQQHWLQTKFRTGNSLKKEILFRPGKDVHRHSPISVEMTATKEGGRLWFGKSSWAMQDEKIDAWLKRHFSRHHLHPN